MRKVLIVIAIAAFVPAMAFAQLRVGVVGMYNGDPTYVTMDTEFGLEDFTFGLDARLGLGILEGSAAFFYFPGATYTYGGYAYVDPDELMVLADVGISLELLFFRFGLGVGPNYYMYLSEGNDVSDAIPLGVNLKGSVDLELGSLGLGLVAYYIADSFDHLNPNDMIPMVGISVLFKM